MKGKFLFYGSFSKAGYFGQFLAGITKVPPQNRGTNRVNILSVKLILFQGNLKNISVGFSDRNNTDSGLFTKKFEQFLDYQGDQKCLLSTDVFLKSQLFLKSTLAHFDTKLSQFEKFCFRPYGKEVWEVQFKSSLYNKYPALSLPVSQKRQLTMKTRMKYSVDVAMTINQCSLRKSTSKAQAFKTVKFLIDYFHSKILKTGRLSNFILFLYLF